MTPARAASGRASGPTAGSGATLSRLGVAVVAAVVIAGAVLHGGPVALRASAGLAAVLALVVVDGGLRVRVSAPLAVTTACLASLYASWWVWRNLPYGFLDARTDDSGLLLWSTIEVAGLSVLAMHVGRWARAGTVAMPVALMVAAGGMAMRLLPREELGVRGFIGGLCVAAVAAASALGWYLRMLDRGREMAVAAARREQRRSLALDLHDLVAHEVTAIAVEAQATRLVGTSAAGESLQRIEAAAGRALDNLDRSIDVLAGGDESRLRPPTPGLAELGRFVGTFDPPVDLVNRVEDVVGIPARIQATAYRVVVEGLGNVRRHAPGSARVVVNLSGRPGELVVSVWNGSRPGTGAGRAPDVADRVRRRLVRRRARRTGLGLAGLRARVEALGGTLVAGPGPGPGPGPGDGDDDDGGAGGGDGWLLTARLPTV